MTNHERFQAHFGASEPARWRVARWLVRSKGYTIYVPPQDVAPTAAQWQEYVDEGDLFVNMRVEVKRRPKMNFTSAADFPYPEGIFVCRQEAFDRADPRPHAFVILNGPGTHAAFIASHTFPAWAIVSVKDSRYRNHPQEMAYRAPLDVVVFSELEHQS